jgi:hypothetical protein
MDARVPEAVVARVDVGRIDVGQVSLGDIVVGQLRVDDARVNIRSGQALLRDLQVSVGLEFTFEWFVDIELFEVEVFSDSGTDSLGVATIFFELGDFEVPGLNDIDLDIASLTGSDVRTQADPIAGLQLAGLVAEDVRATGVVLPTAGFTLAGLDLASLTVADVDLPAAGVAGATVGRVRGTPLTLPSLRLRGLELPGAAAGDIRSGALDIPVQRQDAFELAPFSLGFFGITLSVRPTASMRASELLLTGIRAALNADLIELGSVRVPFEVHNLTLADVGLHTIDVPTITVAQS